MKGTTKQQKKKEKEKKMEGWKKGYWKVDWNCQKYKEVKNMKKRSIEVIFISKLTTIR